LAPSVRDAVREGWVAGVEHARDQLATGARAPAEPRLETELAAATAAVAKVAQTRLTEVAEVLAKGVEQGAAPQQLAKKLRGVLDDRRWADTVAVTETAWAMSEIGRAHV